MRQYLSTSIVLLLGSWALAQDAKSERTIATIGTATVYAKPDTAQIHYGVTVTEPSADAVKEVLGKHSKAIEEAINKLKLGKLVVTTGPMGLKQASNPNAGGGIAIAPGGGAAPANPGLGPFSGHTSQTATISNADPEKLRTEVESFLKAIIDAGANTNGGEPKEANVNFFPGQGGSAGPRVVLSRSDDSAVRSAAYEKAVAQGMKNARAIANGLGTKEITVVSVVDEPEKPVAEPLNIYGLESPNAHRSPAGEIEIKVRVIVKCKY